jgi:ketosteroid isomerase-like protein
MSQQNVDVVHAFTEAFNAGDIEALVACCDPKIELHSTFAAIGGAIYHGHEGMRNWRRDLEEAWGGEIRSALEALFDLGERMLVFTVLYGRGRQSGVEVGLPAAMVVKADRDRLVYFKGYWHREDALRDLGVSEDALEPIAP